MGSGHTDRQTVWQKDWQSPYLLQRHIIIIIILWNANLECEYLNMIFCLCVPWYSNTFETTVWSFQLSFFFSWIFNKIALISLDDLSL